MSTLRKTEAEKEKLRQNRQKQVSQSKKGAEEVNVEPQIKSAGEMKQDYNEGMEQGQANATPAVNPNSNIDLTKENQTPEPTQEVQQQETQQVPQPTQQVEQAPAQPQSQGGYGLNQSAQTISSTTNNHPLESYQQVSAPTPFNEQQAEEQIRNSQLFKDFVNQGNEKLKAYRERFNNVRANTKYQALSNLFTALAKIAGMGDQTYKTNTQERQALSQLFEKTENMRDIYRELESKTAQSAIDYVDKMKEKMREYHEKYQKEKLDADKFNANVINSRLAKDNTTTTNKYDTTEDRDIAKRLADNIKLKNQQAFTAGENEKNRALRRELDGGDKTSKNYKYPIPSVNADGSVADGFRHMNETQIRELYALLSTDNKRTNDNGTYRTTFNEFNKSYLGPNNELAIGSMASAVSNFMSNPDYWGSLSQDVRDKVIRYLNSINNSQKENASNTANTFTPQSIDIDI